jgi:tetratricopeptide (TPR) repeat protein
MHSLDLARQGLAIQREIGDRRREAIALSNLGVSWLNLGSLVQARTVLNEALRMLRANGDRLIEGHVLSHLSRLALMQGDDARALALARSALEIAVTAQARDNEAIALLRLGDAELALGRMAAARQAFEGARALATEVDDPCRHDATAGLARVALAQGDSVAALREVEALLAHIAGGGSWEGVEVPRLIELTCHRVLARANDPRAGHWLLLAHEGLQARAMAIADAALRQGFLQNIPVHREIVAAWAVWQQTERGSAARQ